MKVEKIILFSNTSWYLYNFRLPLAIALRDHGYDVVMIAPHDEFSSRLVGAGFKVIDLPMQRNSLNPIRELFLLLRLWKIIRAESAEIILNFTIKCAVYGSLVSKLSAIRRRINAVAGLGAVFTSDSIKAKILLPLVKMLFRWTLVGNQSRLILQNPDDVNLFIENSILPENCIDLIKGSGVNADRFNIKKKLSWEKTGVKRILFASRLLWSKGIAYFVDAAKTLDENKGYEFLIAGTPDEGNIASVDNLQLKEWADQGYVSLLGHVDKVEVLMSEVDLVVLPSSYGEGVPRILIEAAASSLPIVAFDNAGSREIVLDEINGYLVEKNNLSELIVAIESVFESVEHYEKMCESSRRHFINNFEETEVISKTISVIRKTKLLEKS